MPRKRWRTPAAISPRIRIEHYEIVRNALVDASAMAHENDDFKKVARLPSEIFEQLVDNLVAAGRIARGNINAGIPHVSNTALTHHIFMRDVKRAMESAGLPVERWLHYEKDGVMPRKRWGTRGGWILSYRESLHYRIAHMLSDVFALDLPLDLKPLTLRARRQRRKIGGKKTYGLAMQIQYGEMSAGMKGWQDAEIARRKLVEWRGWLGDHAFREQTAAFLLQQRGRSRTPQCLGRMSVVSLLVEPCWENLQPTPIEL
jgi:hypothetical protein